MAIRIPRKELGNGKAGLKAMSALTMILLTKKKEKLQLGGQPTAPATLPGVRDLASFMYMYIHNAQ